MGLDRFVLMAGSYGGGVALEYASHHPERISVMVLRDTSADWSHRQLVEQIVLSSSRSTIEPDHLVRLLNGNLRSNEDFRRGLAAVQPLGTYNWQPEPYEQILARLSQVPADFELHNAIYQDLQSYDVTQRLRNLPIPVLCVGRHDWIMPVPASEKIHDAIPNSRLVVFEESAHSPHTEEPERFRNLVSAWLTEHVGL